MTIDTFDIAAGWSQRDDILSDDDNFSEAIETAGFSAFDRLGAEGSGGIETFRRKDGGFLVDFEALYGGCLSVFCPNLASYLALLGQLEPWFRMIRASNQDQEAVERAIARDNRKLRAATR